MNPEWSSGRLFQPMGGFAPPMQTPSYTGVKFKSKDSKSLPSFKGIDFATGKNVDLAKYFETPSYGVAPLVDSSKEESAIPDVDPKIKSWLELYKATSPQRLAEMEAAANISAQLSERQLAQLYPYLSRAGAEATARSLAASKEFLAAKQAAPTTIQEIMASKQGQMASAAAAEATLQQATADQLRAAKEAQGRFAGQYVQFG
jgi:hypothetical protein